MNVFKQGQSVGLKATASLEYADVGENLAVYRLTKEITAESPPPGLLTGTASKTVTEGFVDMRELQLHLAGTAPFPHPAERVTLVPSNFQTLAARYGYSEGMDKAKEADKRYDRSSPFAAIVERKISLNHVLLVDDSSNMLFDRQGNVLPTGISFEYIMAGMHDARYDLTRALEILKQNDRVHFLDHYGYPVETPNILSIPSYNVTEAQTKYLNFVFEPTADEMRRLWERQLSYGDRYASLEVYRAAFELDILGLRAGEAAFFESYAQTVDD